MEKDHMAQAIPTEGQPPSPVQYNPVPKMLIPTEEGGMFYAPSGTLTGGISVSSDGKLFFGNGNGIAIYEPDGIIRTNSAHSRKGESVDGPFNASTFSDAGLMAIDSSDNLFVEDNGLIRKVTADLIVSTIIDLREQSGFDPKTLVDVRGLATDSLQNVFYAAVVFVYDDRTDKYITADRSIRKVAPDGAVELIEDLPLLSGFQHLGGLGAIRLDAEQNLYIVEGRTIFKRWANGRFSVFATLGEGSRPNDMVIDSDGTLYVSDTGHRSIRRITPDAKVSTLMEMDTPKAMALLGPHRIAIIAKGGIYEVDALIPQAQPEIH